MSQSTIKMEKGYYQKNLVLASLTEEESQSTIKMEKGYYGTNLKGAILSSTVAIHNKNGKGLLQVHN